MPVIEILLEDHRQIKKSMDEIAAAIATITFTSMFRELNNIFDNFCNQLSIHFLAENKVLYQALKVSPFLKKRVLKSHEAHNMIEEWISQLKKLSIENECWAAKFMIIRDFLSLHLMEEESEIFPVAKEILPIMENEALANRINKERSGLV